MSGCLACGCNFQDHLDYAAMEAEIRDQIVSDLERAREDLAWTGDPAGFWVGGMSTAIDLVRGDAS